MDDLELVGWQVRVRQAIAARDLETLTGIAWDMGIAGVGDEYARLAHEELAAAPHETQAWWGMPCNCTGHLN